MDSSNLLSFNESPGSQSEYDSRDSIAIEELPCFAHSIECEQRFIIPVLSLFLDFIIVLVQYDELCRGIRGIQYIAHLIRYIVFDHNGIFIVLHLLGVRLYIRIFAERFI